MPPRLEATLLMLCRRRGTHYLRRVDFRSDRCSRPPFGHRFVPLFVRSYGIALLMRLVQTQNGVS